MVQALVVEVAVHKEETYKYETVTLQSERSVVQVLVIRVDIGVVTFEVMTPLCGRSIVQILVVIVDRGVVTYEALKTPVC